MQLVMGEGVRMRLLWWWWWRWLGCGFLLDCFSFELFRCSPSRWRIRRRRTLGCGSLAKIFLIRLRIIFRLLRGVLLLLSRRHFCWYGKIPRFFYRKELSSSKIGFSLCTFRQTRHHKCPKTKQWLIRKLHKIYT